MNVTIPNGKELKKALSILKKLKTGTVQIRAYDCFSEDGERVEIERWNRKAVICVKLDAAVAEPGCCGVDLKDLSDAVTNGEITITSTPETVTITGATISKIPVIAYEPAMFGGEPDDEITLTDEDAKRIRLSIPFISKDETRIDFTGALIRDGHVVATDGHRLRAAELSCAPKEGVIIPPLVCELVGAGTLSIYRKDAVRFESDRINVIASTIDGQFPDFSKVIPKNPPVTGTLRVSDTLKAIKVTAKGYKVPQALMTAAPGADVFNATVHESYDGKGLKKADCTGNIPLARIDGNFSASFNLNYWIDALNGFEGQETVEFGFLDADSPFVLSKDGVSAVIMPMEW